MFFLIPILFIIQLIFVVVFISVLLNLDINILLFTDKIADCNNWFENRKKNIEMLFSDFKMFIVSYKKYINHYQMKFVFSQLKNVLEYFLLIMVKPNIRKVLLGYKVAYSVFKKLSIPKNML